MKAKKTPVIRAEQMKPRALKKATAPYGDTLQKVKIKVNPKTGKAKKAAVVNPKTGKLQKVRIKKANR